MSIQRHRARSVFALAGLGLALILGPGAARADILVQGSTTGVFNTGTSNVLSLSFAGSSFGPQSSNLGLNLGQFSLSCGGLNICNDNYQPYTFDLTVSFTVPVGAGSTVVTADVTGKLQGYFIGDTNTVGINFGGPNLVTYSNASGSGQFYLNVNDIAAGGIPVYGSAEVTGSITGATFVPNVSSNPEPGSVVLLGSMIGIVGIWMRKRIC